MHIGSTGLAPQPPVKSVKRQPTDTEREGAKMGEIVDCNTMLLGIATSNSPT